MRVADSRRPSRLLRFRLRSQETDRTIHKWDEHELPTDIRELKRLRHRIIVLAVLGLVAFLASWYAR